MNKNEIQLYNGKYAMGRKVSDWNVVGMRINKY